MDVGDSIDRFVVEDIIGRGGVATVYLLRHTTLKSAHALKVLHASSAAVRERLVREATAQANLRHPNVVQVTDLLDVEGDPGIVMEYIAGPSLEAMLTQQKPPVPEGLRLFRGIVRGVAHAHAHGWIHRDLKPGNILLDSLGGQWVPKICDFGLVKVVEADPNLSGRTHQGVAMGTPGYMAPEQIRDAASVDQRADMFSLGALLYEIMTGMRAFQGPTVLAVLNKVAKGDYPPPTQHVPELQGEIVRLIDSLMQVDPDDRLADCQQVLDALDGVDAKFSTRTTVELPSDHGSTAPAKTGPVGPAELGGIFVAVAAVLIGVVMPLPEIQARTHAPKAALADVVEPHEPEPAEPEEADEDEEEEEVQQAEPPPLPASAGRRVWASKKDKTGLVRLRGARQILLVDDGRHYGVGRVPAGSYDVYAWFGGAGWVNAGRTRVRANKTQTVECEYSRKRCR